MIDKKSELAEFVCAIIDTLEAEGSVDCYFVKGKWDIGCEFIHLEVLYDSDPFPHVNTSFYRLTESLENRLSDFDSNFDIELPDNEYAIVANVLPAKYLSEPRIENILAELSKIMLEILDSVESVSAESLSIERIDVPPLLR